MGEIYDVAIVGAGVVGCALFREFVLAGQRTVLIERDADIINGASKANSALLHTGFDAVPGSLEAACVRRGHARYAALHDRLGLPLLPCGALVVAWSDAERQSLPGIAARAEANGVAVDLLDVASVRAREPGGGGAPPAGGGGGGGGGGGAGGGAVALVDVGAVGARLRGLAADLQGGVLVAGEAVIDAWSAPLAYAWQGIANGGVLLRDTEVTGGSLHDGIWQLATNRPGQSIAARVVVNCAGNYGDLVEAIARPSPFAIRPRRGQFVVYDKPAYALVRSIVLPVPNERTKGVVVARTAYGNLLVGPTAEDQDDRRDASVETASLRALIAAGERMVPALAGHSVTTSYAGLRPASQFKDYQIEALPTRRWITVGGIRSTGLTGALGIAEHAVGLHGEHFGTAKPLPAPVWPRVPNLAEASPRPWQSARSEIVCHCEMVTRGEIEAAFQPPLPAGSLGGLKRRTRCMMGRCQGFYCTRRVMEIAAPHLPGLVQRLVDA